MSAVTALAADTETTIMSDLQAAHGRLYTDTAGVIREIEARLPELRAAVSHVDRVGAMAPAAKALELLSIGNRILGNYEAALEQNAESQSLYEAMGDRLGVAKAAVLAGNVHWCLGAFEKALVLYERALPIRRQLGDRLGEAGALGSIGVVLDELGRYADARRHFEESLAISRELGDRAFAARTLNNLGETCLNLGDAAAAHEHCAQALVLFRALADHAEEANVLSNLGKICRAQGNFPGAAENFTAALNASERIGDQRAQAETRMFLGALHTEQAAALFSPLKARVLLEAALTQAESIGVRAVEFAIHRELARAHELLGDTAEALRQHRKFSDIQSEVFNENSSRRLRQLQISYELDRARRETELERQKTAELTRLNGELAAQREQLDRAVRDLLRVNQEKNDLLGIAAHDLKNPLASIIGLADLWLMDAGTANDIRQIHSTAEAMLGLVKRLLDVNEIDSGVAPLSPRPLDLAPLLNAVIDDYAPAADAKGLNLNLAPLPAPLVALADPLAARRILDNLVSNAVKYSSRGGTVVVSAGRNNDTVELAVRDDGPGLTADDHTRLFQRFARLSSKPTGGEHSSGLGLFITKRLVETMHGRIACQSAPGQGATFRVSLPAG